MDNIFYTVDEAAEKIGVHTKTIRRYIYSGKIKALKIGGQWRISEEDLSEYLSTGSCCGESNESNSDDFCVFMDGGNFSTDEKFQICSIVDYYTQSPDELKPVASEIMDIVTSYNLKNISCKFNYLYDQSQKKARFVLWGSPDFMSEIMDRLSAHS